MSDWYDPSTGTFKLDEVFKDGGWTKEEYVEDGEFVTYSYSPGGHTALRLVLQENGHIYGWCNWAGKIEETDFMGWWPVNHNVCVQHCRILKQRTSDLFDQATEPLWTYYEWVSEGQNPFTEE